jgi:hypothetical protein
LGRHRLTPAGTPGSGLGESARKNFRKLRGYDIYFHDQSGNTSMWFAWRVLFMRFDVDSNIISKWRV